MLRFLKWLVIVIVGTALAVWLFLLAMRLSDGPVAVIPGGPFRSGEPTPIPADWGFLRDRMEVEFQTMDPATSRTVWVGVHDTRLFLVSGYMTTWYGGIWKQWPHYMGDDTRIVLRVDDSLYDLQLERVMEGPDVAPVLSEFARKYSGAAPGAVTNDAAVTSGSVWMYEAVAR